ncbi:hypothetical protein SAY86_002474 [Trapa natans]|uniref:GATA-type domain-containing protein n=1 Tax=Trapa natans TaxID=22666 RepID=A0AAN7LR21_TRANT|nr:hypothetical protein SAY86_002474 [Trapa natans]
MWIFVHYLSPTYQPTKALMLLSFSLISKLSLVVVVAGKLGHSLHFIMTPTYHMINPPSTFIDELNCLSSSSSSWHTLFSSSDQDHGGPCRHELQTPVLGSKVSHATATLNLFEKKQEIDSDEEEQGDCNSTKWLPKKIRIVRKMMGASQASEKRMVTVDSAPKMEIQEQHPSPSFNSDESGKGSSYRNSDSAVRVCSSCNTTKTPLWRSGPRGPKSLCNACGIRQRKAKRALAAAAAAAASGGNVLPPATSSVKVKAKGKTKRTKNGHADGRPRIKRGRKDKSPPSPSSPPKTSDLCYKDFTLRILGKHYSAYHKVFPQDEREAAILLMALSHGLVRG